MTNKEALKALQEIKTYVSTEHLEALNYAIEMLSKAEEAKKTEGAN